MKVQITIPILDPAPSFFSNVIPSLLSQTLHSNILLINSGSDIQIGEYEILTINKEEFNHANTRNMALANEAEYYLFMTQDAIAYDKHLIANLIHAFDDDDVVITYARQLPQSDADPIEKFARETNYPPNSYVKSKEDLPILGIKTFFSSNSCAMYRGNYFQEIGGFTKNLNTSEDMEFAARAIMAGKKVAYCAHAKVVHSHQFTFRQIWNRYYEIGTFFARNRWITDVVSNHTRTETTGIKQALSEIKYLFHNAPLWLMRSIFISLIKYCAFKCGQNNTKNH